MTEIAANEYCNRNSLGLGQCLGHHAEEFRLAVDELHACDAECVLWDVPVVGTGMGGGMLGHSLARSSRRVLFVEKGRSTLPDSAGTIRAAMPEVAEPSGFLSKDTCYNALARAGPLNRRDHGHQRTCRLRLNREQPAPVEK